MRNSWAWAFAVILIVSPGARAAGEVFDSNGVRIHYVVDGEGEAVVLIHGFAVGAAMWVEPPPAGSGLVPALAGEYRVIAPDLRGHGASGKPHDPAKYGAEMVEDIVRLLDHLDIRKAHVVGYSMGTAIAGTLLVSHPGRLLSVTFGGGAPTFGAPTAFDAVLDATAASLEAGKGAGPLLIANIPPGQPRPSPEQAAAISERWLANQDPQALAAVLRGRGAWSVPEEQLKASRVPVCFVYGSEEGGVKELIAAARTLLPHARVREVEGADHFGAPVRPEFREALRDCFRRAAGP